MKGRSWIVAAAMSFALGTSVPAFAASPSASCVGQEISVFARALGADLGAAIAFEARHPELEGLRNLGEEFRFFAHGDRQDCPTEG
jgi:hypothetical protein